MSYLNSFNCITVVWRVASWGATYTDSETFTYTDSETFTSRIVVIVLLVNIYFCSELV